MSDSTTRGISSASVDDLLTRIRDPDENIAGPACQGAGPYGAAAIKPLVALMADSDFEIGRKAKRAVYWIVRYAGRPGATQEAGAVEAELIPLLQSGPSQVRRDLAWMLSEIGGTRSIPPLAALLSDKDVREDARCALTRHPNPEAVTALKAAFGTAPEDFKYALVESLRQRGEKVEGYPSRKLVPTGQTTVRPIQPKKN